MSIRFAAVFYAAVSLALAAFAGSALAGNGHGNGNGGNSANAPGQQKQQPAGPSTAQPASSSTQAPVPATPAPAATHGNSASAPGHAKHSSGTSHASSASTKHTSSAGVKPSSTTAHEQKPTYAPASSNRTKLYGNGKTAGQIATAAGYGSATLYGPGNSQPHKALTCRGHYVDVHALKAQSKKCATQPAKPAETPAPQVTHSTQSTSSHTTAPCVATKTTTEQVAGGVEHFTGPKGSGRFVVIHPSTHSAHYRDKHPDVILPSTTVTRTVVVGSTTCTTSQSTQSTQSTSSATQSSSSAAAVSAQAAPAPTTPAPTSAPAPTAAGGVLGAVTPLHTAATPKATGGVLGSIVRLGRRTGGTTLPFTGLQLWIFALAAAGLILAGALVRRAGSARS